MRTLLVAFLLSLSTAALADCETDADCKGGKVCRQNQCVREACYRDMDCPADQMCSAGACVTAPTRDAPLPGPTTRYNPPPRDRLPANPPFSPGFELAIRTGYGVPLGKADGAATLDLSTAMSGFIPLQIDAGLRVTPTIFIGAYGQYGLGFTGDSCKATTGTTQPDCSTSSLRLGLQVQAHVSPYSSTDLWVGAGAGWEKFSYSATQGTTSAELTASGLEYLNLQAGLAFKAGKITIGPFAMLTIASYGSESLTQGGTTRDADVKNTAIHELVEFGLRLCFQPL